MDILTHALSGAVVAIGVASVLNFRPFHRMGLVFTGIFGGIMPDIDAISMWSHFDATFGRFLGLAYSGRVIYGAKFWYSHHAFFHSFAASILLGFLFMCTLYFVHRFRTEKIRSMFGYFKANITLYTVFVLGYWSHLAGDLPTPASLWGGINLLWPFPGYIGGYGKIWWWNNYDVFLILLFFTVTGILMLIAPERIAGRIRRFTVMFTIAAFILVVVQINTRTTDYGYIGNTDKYAFFEEQSRKEQKHILGYQVYHKMDLFDKWLKINF